MNLKGNPLKKGLIEISKAFIENKNALCLKELDLSKCVLESEHLGDEFLRMIKSEYTTLKVINMRDNLIKHEMAEKILEALKINKRITKINLDYNPIKHNLLEQIDHICKRNLQLDQINQKNKNLIELQAKKNKAKTQRQLLLSEIKELKRLTDKSINESQEALTRIEMLQQQRKTSNSFFVTVVPHLPMSGMGMNSSCNQSIGDCQSRSASMLEPMTAMNKNTGKRVVQFNRYMSQGPMRSEKVYLMTQLLNQKAEQLTQESSLIMSQYQGLEDHNDGVKHDIKEEYESLKKDKQENAERLVAQDKELESLDKKKKEIEEKYKKLFEKY